MNPDVRVESLLERLLVESPPLRAPDQLRLAIASETSRRRQRPHWLASLKEPPMRYRSRVVFGSPTARVAALAAVTMLIAIVGAGALVAGAQSPSPAPPEVPTPMPPAWVTGTIGPETGVRTSQPRSVDGVEAEFVHHTDLPIEMSDPRLTGTYSQVFTTVVHPVAGDAEIWVSTGEYRIANEAGDWEGTGVGMERHGSGPSDTVSDTGVLIGSGAYEGMTAYLVFDWGTWPGTVTGAIFPGELPPEVTFEE